MHVALLAASQWLDEDLTTFRQLVVGLIDEQVRVLQAIPESLAEDDASTFGERVTWRDFAWQIARRRRVAALANTLDSAGVDFLHALDGGVWQGTLDLCKKMGVPALLSASAQDDLALADRALVMARSQPIAFTGTTQPLVDALREKAGNDTRVQLIRPGVHRSNHNHLADASPDRDAFCAVVSGNGVFDHQYQALLEALTAVRTNHPTAQFFFDGQSADQHTLWQWAQRFDLLANISMVPHRLGHREVMLRADALIHPQAMHRSRTLTLQAMARGVPVLALQDPWLDYLIDDQTAWVVEKPDAQTWAALIENLITSPDRRNRLTRTARQWVARTHLASTQVDQTLKLYKQVSGEAIKFPAA